MIQRIETLQIPVKTLRGDANDKRAQISLKNEEVTKAREHVDIKHFIHKYHVSQVKWFKDMVKKAKEAVDKAIKALKDAQTMYNNHLNKPPPRGGQRMIALSHSNQDSCRYHGIYNACYDCHCRLYQIRPKPF